MIMTSYHITTLQYQRKRKIYIEREMSPSSVSSQVHFTYLDNEHMLRHILSQSKEASLGIIPRVHVQFFIIRVQGLMDHHTISPYVTTIYIYIVSCYHYVTHNTSRHWQVESHTFMMRDMPNSKFPLAQYNVPITIHTYPHTWIITSVI